MSEIDIREFEPDDIESFHALHDAVFPPVPFEEMRRWMSRDDVTAGVAIQDGRIVGEIPLHTRQFVLRPGVTVRVAFEHCVCVDASMRGQGVGTRIQDAMKQFMRDRVEVLTVYRGGERTPAYNHYDSNGLTDCCYVRSWKHDAPAAVAESLGDLLPSSEIVAREDEFAACFRSAYEHAGGYEDRLPGYYETTFTQLEAVELGLDYAALTIEREGRLLGHCIMGLRDERQVLLHELATRGRDPVMATRLLRGVCAVAAAREHGVTVTLHDRGVYTPVFEALGFAPQPRGDMIMACPLDPERLANAVWAPRSELSQVRVRVWTPQEEFVAHDPGGTPAREITLEMKHHQAVRWLMCRLDLAPLVAQEIVTIRGARPGDVEALSRAIPFTAWEYQGIDHI
ncbi:MAG: GNAT family N-acetyltransferase [Armatimonadota bacterium]